MAEKSLVLLEGQTKTDWTHPIKFVDLPRKILFIRPPQFVSTYDWVYLTNSFFSTK